MHVSIACSSRWTRKEFQPSLILSIRTLRCTQRRADQHVFCMAVLRLRTIVQPSDLGDRRPTRVRRDIYFLQAITTILPMVMPCPKNFGSRNCRPRLGWITSVDIVLTVANGARIRIYARKVKILTFVQLVNFRGVFQRQKFLARLSVQISQNITVSLWTYVMVIWSIVNCRSLSKLATRVYSTLLFFQSLAVYPVAARKTRARKYLTPTRNYIDSATSYPTKTSNSLIVNFIEIS